MNKRNRYILDNRFYGIEQAIQYRLEHMFQPNDWVVIFRKVTYDDWGVLSMHELTESKEGEYMLAFHGIGSVIPSSQIVKSRQIAEMQRLMKDNPMEWVILYREDSTHEWEYC
jgi:hypothetical protein